MLSIISQRPSLDSPVSQACTQDQFDDGAYTYWCERIREPPRYHRKQWEFCYILQVLATRGMLAPGRAGLGFGVGTEPISAVLVNAGCRLVATDLDVGEAEKKGWTATDQHAPHIEMLNARGICDPTVFRAQVDFRFVDMNDIPTDLVNFDFTWSACCLEHLGSLDAGLDFIENSLNTLKPRGVAVHTTELNCRSDMDTIEAGGTVIYRKRDIIRLCERLASKGHDVTLNFELGSLPLDRYVDEPPYNPDKHLKLLLDGYVTTSFGIVVKRSA